MSAKRQMTLMAALVALLLALLLAGLLVADRARERREAPPRRAPVEKGEAPLREPRTGSPSDATRDGPSPSPPSQAPADPPEIAGREGTGPGAHPAAWHVRFHDARTGEVLKDLEGTTGRAFLRFGGGIEVSAWNDWRVRPDSDGWVPVDSVPVPGGVDAGTFWEAAVPGYERKRLVPGELGDRTEVSLEPWTPSARGTLILPEGEVRWISSDLLAEERREDLAGLAPRGLPKKAGEFVLRDLPEGRYELRVEAMVGGVRRLARVRFEKGAGPAELGEIRPEPGSVLRARVVDAGGLPVDRCILEIADASPWVRLAGRPLDLEARGPKAGFREEGDGGWFRFEDLAPGARYALKDPALPGVSMELEAPASGADPPAVELRWTGRWVRCRLRFTAEGQTPPAWDSFWSPALARSQVAGGREVEAELASGTHPVIALWGVRRFRGAIEVPAEEYFEAVVDLRQSPQGEAPGGR